MSVTASAGERASKEANIERTRRRDRERESETAKERKNQRDYERAVVVVASANTVLSVAWCEKEVLLTMETEEDRRRRGLDFRPGRRLTSETWQRQPRTKITKTDE